MTSAHSYLIAGVFSVLLITTTACPAFAQQPARKKAAPAEIDPWYRPEGSIVDKSMRYYVWYEGNVWHLRACARTLRNFHGTLRVTGGTVKSCLPVGLKERSKTGDVWSVNADRTVLKFNFSTLNKSDGLDIRIDGDEAEIEFDLHIGQQQGPRLVFIGKNQQHPPGNPFKLPAAPPKPKK
jgi:hypothetical protein